MDKLEVGASVFISSHWNCSIEPIERETKTLWVTSRGTRINKSTLRVVGSDGWDTRVVRLAVEQDVLDIKEANRRRDLLNIISNCSFSEVTTESLKQIVVLSKDKN